MSGSSDLRSSNHEADLNIALQPFFHRVVFHNNSRMTNHIDLPSPGDHVYNNPGPNPSESSDSNTESDDSGSNDSESDDSESNDSECRQYVMDRDNAITKALTDGADQCCILLEPIIPGDYYTVCSQCKNHFDLDAFEAWCNRRPSCPICRFDADKMWPCFICVESS